VDVASRWRAFQHPGPRDLGDEPARRADILREELDGAAAIAADNPNLPKHDATWWENYRAPVERAARAAEPDKP
jgi:hypothetical protein